MIRILIADDEPHFRKYMQSVVDWEDLNFSIVGVKKNGLEVLEFVKEHPIDVALLDISMPNMDGITLAKELLNISSEILIVFITGYSEFEYARQAVQLGVQDYILKPFNKNEIMSVLSKIRIKIKKQKDVKDGVNYNKQLLQESVLYQITKSKYLIKDIEKKISSAEIGFVSDIFMVTIVEVNVNEGNKNILEEMALWKFCITNYLEEVVQIDGNQFIIHGDGTKVIAILNFRDRDSALEFSSCPYEGLCRFVERHFGFTICVGVGNQVEELDMLNRSYESALMALETRFIANSSVVIQAQFVANDSQDVGFYRLDIYNRIWFALRKNDIPEIESIVNELKEYITSRNFTVEYIYSIFKSVISINNSYLDEIATIEHQEPKFNQEIVYKQKSLEECCELLLLIFTQTIHQTKTKTGKRSLEIIASIQKYIEEHYSNSNLTVEEIAKHMYLDASYLRKIFNKQMNGKVSEYITMVRMEKARTLLLSKTYSITEVAFLIGYNDSGYFSKCFKKYFGNQPSFYLDS